MRTLRTLALIAAGTALAAATPTPAAGARIDKCVNAIAAELQKAGSKSLTQLFKKGQTPGATLNTSRINKKCPTLPAALGYTGCPGIADCPRDTNATPAGLEACLNCLLKATPSRLFQHVHAAKCGNGTVDAPAESCDNSACPSCQGCGTLGSSNECSCSIKPSPKLAFTIAPGTAACGMTQGGESFNPGPNAPFSGGIFDARDGGGTKLADLGLGCLYFGGGNATLVPPGPIPDGPTTLFETTCVAGQSTLTLAGSDGTSARNCSRGPSSGPKHCANDLTITCTSDANCPTGGVAAPCQPDPRCYFGPPLPLPNPAIASLSACVLNVIASDAVGTVNPATGDVNLTTFPLSSYVYVTADLASPCPKCIANKCVGGKNDSADCTSQGPAMTTIDCPPQDNTFAAPLPVNLAPLSTGTTTANAAGDGTFCSASYCNNAISCTPTGPPCEIGVCTNGNPGAFGKPTALSIREIGTPAGDITDLAAHALTLAYTFCIPPTGGAADGASDLPGPGAVSIRGTVQLQP